MCLVFVLGEFLISAARMLCGLLCKGLAKSATEQI